MQGSTVTADYGAAAEKLSGTVSWILQDGQGSTRQLLNGSQTVVANSTDDAFGNAVSRSGTSANPFVWNGGNGYYSDAESGLQKVGARYYDPAVGMWISQDTMLVAGSPADSQALNRYVYCEANPVDVVDPTGRAAPPWWWRTIGVTAAAAGLIIAYHMWAEYMVDQAKKAADKALKEAKERKDSYRAFNQDVNGRDWNPGDPDDPGGPGGVNHR